MTTGQTAIIPYPLDKPRHRTPMTVKMISNITRTFKSPYAGSLPFPAICLLAVCMLLVRPIFAAEAAPIGERWFQVELTAFAHETTDLEMEIWTPARLSLSFPERLQKLRSLSDFLQLDDWTTLSGIVDPVALPVSGSGIPTSTLTPPVTPTPVLIGPRPYAPRESFHLPDFEREAFLALPESDHDFTGSNRAISQSSAYRLLFHSAWRQPMTRRNTATAVAVSGGRVFNDRSELEGSVSLYFNNAEDRVVFDSNLWLSTFSTSASTEEGWALPTLPAVMARREVAASIDNETQTTEYFVNRIMQLRQTRDMRSDEFHYIDHPAMGILVQITPYIVPEIPVTEVEAEVPTAPQLFQ